MIDSEAGPRLFPEDHAEEIFASPCGEETLQVLDDPEYRWLKFRYGTLQSAMNKRRPERLVLPYTRAMVSALLFSIDPKQILILGLGGGSLVRFFLHHYPEARLTVVEREPNCLAIARELFHVPSEHPRLELIAGDARRVVPGLRGPYDLVLVDLFLAHGPPAWLRLADLFNSCRDRMTEGGVISANMWTDPGDESLANLGGITSAFGGRALLIPVSGYRNLIVQGFRSGHHVPNLVVLRARARALSRALQFDLHTWLRIIEGTNRVEKRRLAV